MEQDMLGVLKFLWSQLTDWRTHVSPGIGVMCILIGWAIYELKLWRQNK